MKFERSLYYAAAFIALTALSGCFSNVSSSSSTQSTNQQTSNATNARSMTDQEACNYYCGEGFKYDRPGGKNRGRERVCTRYPLSCGYSCTKSWDIHHLVNGSNYTCQTAIQQAPAVNTRPYAPPAPHATRPMTDQEGCFHYCGEGFKYDRRGGQNNGQERVCTRYPKPCGYSCTKSWDIRHLVNGSNFTCQTAIQR